MKKQKIQQNSKREPQNQLAQLYLWLLLTVFVLYPGLGGYAKIGDAKKHAAAVLTGGYVLLSLLLQAELILTGQRAFPKPAALWKSSSWVQRGLILYLVLSCVAALLSGVNAWHGLSRGEGLWTIVLYVGSFLLLSVYGSLTPQMIDGFGAAMSLCAMVALLQLLGKNPLHLFPGDLTYYDAELAYHGQYLGTVGNADLTAGLLSMAVPVFAVTIWKGKRPSRFWLSVPLALCLTVLLWSHIASGVVALVVGTLVCAASLQTEKRRRRAAWIVAAVLAAAGLLVLFLWDPVTGTLHELHEVLHGRVEVSFGSYRIYIWKQVLELSGQHLLFGIGPDTLAAYGLDGFYDFDAAGNMTAWSAIDLAHNEYLQILVSQGLPALLMYLGALICTGIGWLKTGFQHPMAAACGSAVLFYSIQVFFGFGLCPVAPIFWAFWALTEREIRGEERKKLL